MKKSQPPLREKLWTTRDGITIATNWIPALRKKTSRLVILSPGFAKYKDAYPMTEICADLSRWGDVVGVDFRGVGKSGGRYTFGGEEYLDLEPILQWARPRYRQVVLLGLSLGSYHSLRAAHAWPELVDKLLLVSCPTRLEDVLLTLGPLRQGWAIATQWKALKKRLAVGANPFFKWGNPLCPKPDASDLAKRLKVPLFLLVGGKDWLVAKSLSRKIYEAASQPKSWTEIPEGNHAEFLYLENPVPFQKWIRQHLP